MKILSFIAVIYLLTMPCQAMMGVSQGQRLLPRPTKCPLGLHQFIQTMGSGNHRFIADKLREYIDFNRDKDAWEVSSIALTVRRMRGIYPADRYAELLDISPEELQRFEAGTAIPNGVVLDKVVKSLLNDDILAYHEEYGASTNNRLEIALSDNGVERLAESIKNTGMTEVFLLSFSQSLQDAETGSADAAQKIAILEDGLKLDYPDAPHTFTELVEEAKPVVEKLLQDNKVVNLQFDELALRKSQEQGQ